MKNATIHMDDDGDHPKDIEIDGKRFPLDSFLLLTGIPSDPPAGHILVYGNSDRIGRLLFSYWRSCCREDPVGAHTIELVARDILDQVTAARRQVVRLDAPETVQ